MDGFNVYNTEYKGLDTSNTPAPDYGPENIPEEIKKRSDWVRSKNKLIAMREAMAQGIEVAGIASLNAEKTSRETEERQDSVEGEFAILKPQAESAISKADEALLKSDSTQLQLDTIVIDGDSSVEAAQARVDAKGEVNATLKARLDKEHNEVTAQLAETAKESLNTLRPTTKSKKAIIAFISDDAMRQELTKLAPIFIEKGVTYTLAVPPNLPGNLAIDYPADLKNLQDGYGFEIVSHTFNHINLTTLTTEAEIEAELVNSQNWLKENGYKGWDILVYPQGGNNELVRKLARKHYKIAIGTLPNNGINEYPLKNYDVARVGLGSYFNTDGGFNQDPRFPSDGSSLEYYKARVDFAIENGQWLIFMMHPWHAAHTEVQQQHIRDLIDYIKLKNVPIMNVSDALDVVGNTVDVGDYHYNTTNKEYFVTGANGVTKSSQIDYGIANTGEYTLDTPLVQFPNGTSVSHITTIAINLATRKPIDIAGVLITHKSSIANDLSYQEYHAINGRVYRSVSSAGGTWGPWINPVRYKSVATAVSATVPAKSTYNHVVSGSIIKHEDVVSVFPAANIESGITYTVFVTSAGDVVIRLANITDTPITLVNKAWRINAMSVLA